MTATAPYKRIEIDFQDSVFLKRIREAYGKLKQTKPLHELLDLVRIDRETGDVLFLPGYYDRFVDPRDDFGTFGWQRYANALEKALAS